ncbi:unnamed protein product [Staurois parvus]|uniref:Uncharacterized protein n=1 Tax=Staurois parvus TaxID=386267 RepID=A0ABN9B9G9_9NEOB|nr:unnamed protein product [Staurois parvus]
MQKKKKAQDFSFNYTGDDQRLLRHSTGDDQRLRTVQEMTRDCGQYRR